MGDYLLGELRGALRREVDIAGTGEHRRRKGLGRGVQVVDGHAVFLHDALRCGIVFDLVTGEAARLALGHEGRVGEDEFGTGLLEPFDEGLQVFLILRQRDGERAFDFVALSRRLEFGVAIAEVVQAPIEVDDLPLAVAQPSLDLGQAMARVAAVGIGADHIRLAFETLADLPGVADGNGIAKDQDIGQGLVNWDVAVHTSAVPLWGDERFGLRRFRCVRREQQAERGQ